MPGEWVVRRSMETDLGPGGTGSPAPEATARSEPG